MGVWTGTESCTVTMDGRIGTAVTERVGTMNAVLIGTGDGRATTVVVHWQRQVGTTKNAFKWWHMIN